MGNIHRSPVWDDPRVKPPYGSVEINWGHPLALTSFYCPFNEGAGSPFRFTWGTRPTIFNGLTYISSRIGLALDGSATADCRIPISTSDYTPAPLTVVIQMEWTTSSNLVVAEINGNAGWSIQTGPTGSGGHLGISVGSGGASAYRTAGEYNNGTPHIIAFGIDGVDNRVYVDGVDDTNATSSTTPTYGSATEINLFSRPVLVVPYTDRMHFIGVAPRKWSVSDAKQFSAAPYAFLRPIIRPRRFVQAAAAAAGSTVRRRLTLLGVGS